MKTDQSIKAVIVAVTILCLVGTMFGSTILAVKGENRYVSTNIIALKESELNIPSVTTTPADINNIELETEETQTLLLASEKLEEKIQNQIPEAEKSKAVYDGMTLEQLAEKLDRSLNSTLEGQGYSFAKHAIDLGVDPYLAVAIVLHETGCKWKCSTLLRTCNNVGGMKSGGNGKCNGGSYASFPSLDEGIKAYMNNLNKNYFSQGLTTPETIGPKYAASSTWASKVNTYIEQIKAA